MAEQGLGPDIKEVYTELGSLVSVLSRNPVVENERVIYEVNSQTTKPFIREHQLEATFPYDTVITTDDVICIEELGSIYMVMNKTAEMFEDSIVEWNVVLYLCNLPTTSHLLRPVEVRDSTSYNMVQGWQIIVDDPLYGLIAERALGTEIDQDVRTGQVPIWRMDLILPKYYGVKPLDRVVFSETEFYKVETVKNYNYPGAVMALLVEDTRPNSTFVGEEVYED